jgi:hypothetical protein
LGYREERLEITLGADTAQAADWPPVEIGMDVSGINLKTAFKPPNTPRNTEKTRHYIENQTHLLGYTNFCSKPLISLRVSAFIGG